MARSIPPTDLLITLMGAPHSSDLTTSVFRLLQAVLGQDGSVQLWACGYATLLTQRSLGSDKPRNLAAWDENYPTTADLAQELITAHRGRLYWYGCRFCSDDRGATDHIPEVVMRPPAGYTANVAAAGKTLLVGVI